MSLAGLQLSETLEVSRLRHQLALGLSFTDALAQQGVTSSVSCRLESMGHLPWDRGFTAHRRDRFAMRYDAGVKKRMEKLLADGLGTAWQLRVFGARTALADAYVAAADAQIYVPRRLSLELVLQAGLPASSTANMRTIWLWPASAYPFAAGSTLIRGRVLRGASLATAKPVAWARLFITQPANDAVFDPAKVVGCAHGDARGEFVLSLDARAMSGASLKNPLDVRLWAFVPPAAAPTKDPLALLPIENGDQAADSLVMRGLARPPTYTQQQSVLLSLKLGETKNDSTTQFLFAP